MDGTQLAWFETSALNVEAGWTILIFTHYFCGPARDSEDRDAGYYFNVRPIVGDMAKPFARAILNYSGPGDIAAIIQGHVHVDGVWYIDDSLCENDVITHKTISCVSTTCDACKFDDMPTEKLKNRELGTITEQAFDVVVLDKKQRKLTFVRIGAPAYDVLTPDGTGNYPIFGDLEYREISY